MESIDLQGAIARGLTLRQIAAERGTSFSNVRYWLRKHGLKTRRGPRGKLPPDMRPRRCRCGETDASKFYGDKRWICSKCQNRYVTERGRATRRKALDALGGRCIACGFDAHESALDLHHRDPAIKDANFASYRGWSEKRIAAELTNCVVLCRNCHAIYHAGALELPS